MPSTGGTTLAAVEAAAKQKAAARKKAEEEAARQERLAALELEKEQQEREKAQLAEEIRLALNNAPSCSCLMYHGAGVQVEMVDIISAAAELDGSASWWGFCEKWEGSQEACYPPGPAVIEATRSPCIDSAMAYCRVTAPPRPSPPPLPHSPPPSPPPSPRPPHPSPPPSPTPPPPPRPPRHPPRPRAPPQREIRGALRSKHASPSPQPPGGDGAHSAGSDLGFDTAAAALLLLVGAGSLLCAWRVRVASKRLRLRAGSASLGRVAAYLPSGLLGAMPSWLLPVAGVRLERVRRDEIASEIAPEVSREAAPKATAEATAEVGESEGGAAAATTAGSDTEEGHGPVRFGGATAEPKQLRAGKKKKAIKAARGPKKLPEERVRIIVDEASGPQREEGAANATKRSAGAVFDL